MEQALRNEEFAAKLALTYAELYDGVSPVRRRVSLRINGAFLDLKNVETHAEQRWSLDDMREVADQADQNVMIFAPDDRDPARLVIREIEALRALAQSGGQFPPLNGPPGQGRRTVMMAAVAAMCFGGLLFGLVPWFADRAAERIPPNAEIALGEELFQQAYLARGATECTAPDGLAALAAMEARLTDGADLPLPLTVRVVREASVNATALSGGHVTIHSGLLQAAEEPDEVAAILAHEIGHVAHRDVTRSQIRAMGSYGLIGLLFGDVFGISAAAGAAVTVSAVIDASYSRDAEMRADAYAHEMMRDAGLPPQALGTFFARIQAQHGQVELGAMRHLASHPDMMERIQAAAAADTGTRTTRPVLTDAQWADLQNICQSNTTEAGDKS
ncbi:MAG: M48 family metallopeptidase [Pseudomonadota bacterium]